jgi:hypothetical protein
MAHPPETPAARPAPSPPARDRGGRRVRQLAQSTLFAAGLAATQFSIPEIDPRFHVFSPHLLDKLQVPISRHHE